MKRLTHFLVLAVMFLSSQLCTAAASAVEPVQGTELLTYELTILHINDHHSHLDDFRGTLLLPTKKDGPREAISMSMGGFPRVTAMIKQLAAQHNHVLKLHAGDATTGTIYHSLLTGQADAALMNTVCFDAMVLGNHEFDLGDSALFNFKEMLWHKAVCKTPLLSANLQPGLESPLAGRVIDTSLVIERGGELIGIVGVSAAEKTQGSSRPDPQTTFSDELSSAQAEVDRLQKQGINKIIVLAHLGYEQEKQLAQQLSGVDVVVGGDSHTLLGSEDLIRYGLQPQGPYPTRLRNADGKAVCVVQAWQYSLVVGELQLSFDEKGDLLQCSGHPHLLIGDDFSREEPALTEAEQNAIISHLAQQDEISIIAPSTEAEAILAPYRHQVNEFSNKVIGHVSEDLCNRRFPGRQGASQSTLAACGIDQYPNPSGGDIQQLVAHAFLMQAKDFGGADISIQNGGSVRIDIAAGPITVGDIYTLLPFRNTMVRLTLTAKEIKQVLEEAIDSVLAGNTGSYPYAAALRWQLDLEATKNQRLSEIQFKEDSGEWVQLDPERSYQIITSDFLADGKDGYTSFSAVHGERREDMYLPYAESFLRFVESTETISRLPLAEYSTQKVFGLPD